MENKEQKEQIQQAKADRKIAKYSSDYDMSVIIKFVFAILGGLISLLAILEAIAVFFFKKEPGVYLSEAIVLAVLAYFAGWGSAIVTYFFMKKAQAQAENGGTNS